MNGDAPTRQNSQTSQNGQANESSAASPSSFTKESITHAVGLLYDPELDPAQIREVQKWLTKAQRCALAWQIGFELLTNRTLSVEVQYFGASMITEKIRYHFSEIPLEETKNVRNQLLEQLIYFSKEQSRRIVMTKLCLALASLASQMIPKKGPDEEPLWPEVISSLVQFCQSHDMLPALIDLLVIMAEELRDGSKTWLVLSKNDRASTRAAMLKDAKLVTSLLTEILNKPENQVSAQLQTLACKAFSAWLQLGLHIQDSIPLLEICINLCLTKDPENFEAFEECCECIQHAFCTPDSFQFQNTIVAFLPRILAFEKILRKSIEDQNESVCLAVTKLICGIGENHTLLIISQFDNKLLHPDGLGRRYVHLVLQCTSNKLQYPTEEKSSPISLSFWYGLQDEYSYRINEIATTLPQLQQELESNYYKLVDALTIKSIHPDFNDGWTMDEQEEFRVYRIDIADTLMYTFNVLEKRMVQFLAMRILHFAKVYLENPTIKQNWQLLESYMTSFASVSEGIEFDDMKVLMGHIIQVISQVAQVMEGNKLLKEAVMNVIGALSDYIYEYPEPALTFFLPIILQQFNPTAPDFDPSASVVLASILTLIRLAREAIFGMEKHAPTILQSIKQAVDSNRLEPNQIAWLMQSAGHAISVLPNSDDCQNWVAKLVAEQCQQLNNICQQRKQGVNDSNSRGTVLQIVSNLRHLFTTIDRGALRKHEQELQASDEDSGFPSGSKRVDDSVLEAEWAPLVAALESVVPLLCDVLTLYARDEDVVKDACIFFERLAKNLDQFFDSILVQIVPTLTKVFDDNPHGNIIEICEYTSLVHFESEAAQTLLGSICVSISQKYSSGGRRFVDERPDVVVEFCATLSMIMRKKFQVFVGILSLNDGDAARVIFEMLLSCLSHDTNEALVRNASSFLGDYYKCASPKHDSCKQLGLHFLPQIIEVILLGISGRSSKVSLEHLSDALFNFSKFTFGDFMTALKSQFQLIFVQRFSTDPNSLKHFERYMQQIFKERSNKHRFKEAVREWSLLCREIYGSDH